MDIFKMQLSIDDFVSLHAEANKSTNGNMRNTKRQALRSLLVDYGRALSKIQELGIKLEDGYEYSSEVRKAR